MGVGFVHELDVLFLGGNSHKTDQDDGFEFGLRHGWFSRYWATLLVGSRNRQHSICWQPLP